MDMFDDDEAYDRVYCPKCFRELAGRVHDNHIKVHVVVFADRCVDPEIQVTFDEELARNTYLKHDRGGTDEDLISWQEVPISSVVKDDD
jgi:hypothetical protein